MDMRQRRAIPPGIQGAFEAQSDFWNGATAPDGRPLVDHLLDAWDLVARHYASWPAVAGVRLPERAARLRQHRKLRA